MDAELYAAERELLVQMGRSRDGDGIDSRRQQRVHFGKPRATQGLGHNVACVRIGVCHANQVHACKIGKDAGMIAAHYTYADDAHP